MKTNILHVFFCHCISEEYFLFDFDSSSAIGNPENTCPEHWKLEPVPIFAYS